MAERTMQTGDDGGFAVASAGQFFSWWKSHLWQCLPSGIRGATIRNRRPLTIYMAEDRVWPERSDWAKSLKLSQTTFLSGDPAKPKPVALLAGEASGLRRLVELPLAVESRLDQVLNYELDRLIPLRAQDVYYDYRIVGRNTQKNLCTVELIALPRLRVDENIAQAARMGGSVERLALNTDDIDNGVNLLRLQKRGEDDQKSANRWITPLLVALCCLLGLALVAFPLYQKRNHVIALQPIESKARAEAEAAGVVQRLLDKQVTEYNHVLKRKHASPIAVQVLEDLGKRLPDDTWAQTFEIKLVAGAPAGTHPREVIIQGETGSGGKLLQLVQESPLLKDPVLKAAMTRVAPTAERFHVAGELLAVAPPAGLVLADSAAVLATPVQVTPNAAAGAPLLGAKPAEKAPEKPAEKAPEKKAADPAKPAEMAKPAETAKTAEPPKAMPAPIPGQGPQPMQPIMPAMPPTGNQPGMPAPMPPGFPGGMPPKMGASISLLFPSELNGNERYVANNSLLGRLA